MSDKKAKKKSIPAKGKTAPRRAMKPAPRAKAGGKAAMLSRIAQGFVQAMGAKTSKKSQTKAAPPMTKGKKAPAAKALNKSPAKVAVKTPAKPVAKAPRKTTDRMETSAPSKKPSKSAAVVAVLAPVGKSGKGKGVSPKSVAQALLHSERMCRESGCENPATTKGYCRLDYIKNWKKIKRKEMILREGKLNQYIEELVSKYPDKYIEVIRQDLSTEVNFTKVIHDLELDESIEDMDYDGDSIDSLIGAIRKEDDGFDDTDF